MSGAKSCLAFVGEDEMKISFIHLFISSEEVFVFKAYPELAAFGEPRSQSEQVSGT